MSDFDKEKNHPPKGRELDSGPGRFQRCPFSPSSPLTPDSQQLPSSQDWVAVVCVRVFGGLLTSVSRTPSLSSALGLGPGGLEPRAAQVLARLARLWGCPELTLP